MKSALAASVALACMALVRPARAADPDPWWAEDKALHFTVSIGLGSGGYAGSALWLAERWQRAVAGAGFSLTLGGGKELYDLGGHGDASWRDFTWDIAGTAVGVGLAYLLDLVLFPRTTKPGPEARKRPLASRLPLSKTRPDRSRIACDCSTDEWPSSPEQVAISGAPRLASSPSMARASW